MENKQKTIIEWAIKGEYPAPKGEYYNKDGTLGGWWYKWKYEDYETGEERENEYPCCFDHPHYFNALIIDPKFFQAIGRAVKWHDKVKCKVCDVYEGTVCSKVGVDYVEQSIGYALHFHELNLTEGIDAAIDYLYGLLPVKE